MQKNFQKCEFTRVCSFKHLEQIVGMNETRAVAVLNYCVELFSVTWRHQWLLSFTVVESCETFTIRNTAKQRKSNTCSRKQFLKDQIICKEQKNPKVTYLYIAEVKTVRGSKGREKVVRVGSGYLLINISMLKAFYIYSFIQQVSLRVQAVLHNYTFFRINF